MSAAAPLSTDDFTCAKCRYDLRGLLPGAVCPQCATPTPERADGLGRTSCIRCGYSLMGLPDAGDCPECGTPVELSRHGVLVRARGESHVAWLQRGVVVVQTAVLIQTALTLSIVLSGMFKEPPPPVLMLLGLIPFAMLAVFLAGMLGWWWLTSPDPRQVEQVTKSQARVVVRAMVALRAVVLAMFFALVLVSALTLNSGVWLLTFGVGVLGNGLLLVSTVIQFFASMSYLRWLAVRLPDDAIVRRVGLVTWLAPLLATVGMIVLIGPLIAVALYWALLESVRKRLKRIREELAAERGDAPAAAAAV